MQALRNAGGTMMSRLDWILTTQNAATLTSHRRDVSEGSVNSEVIVK